MANKVLIIDDEEVYREDIATMLRLREYACATASNAEEGLTAAEEFSPDVIFCDVVMPGRSGIDILDELILKNPESSVIIITGYGNLSTALEAFRKGAVDYIIKPVLIEDVLQKIERLLKYKLMAQEVRLLRREVSKDVQSLHMVGHSKPMEQVFELIQKVAPTRSTVLITGESGTGKELVARAIHPMSESHGFPFVAINCSSIPEHLFESELFGHVRGAFTGAINTQEGLFELARNGTVFLDEIGEMPLALQSKFLRVLEQKEFTRVGSGKGIPLEARVIASTNRDLKELVKEGRFREDLFFRIAVFEIHIPPLRERRADIPILVDYFVRQFNEELKRGCLGVNNEVMHMLMSHSWPGNVRELKNVIERAMILTSEEYITPQEITTEIVGTTQVQKFSDNLKDAVHAYEKEYIRRTLEECDGNRDEAARRLGIHPATLYRKMNDLPGDDKGRADSPADN